MSAVSHINTLRAPDVEGKMARIASSFKQNYREHYGGSQPDETEPSRQPGRHATNPPTSGRRTRPTRRGAHNYGPQNAAKRAKERSRSRTRSRTNTKPVGTQGPESVDRDATLTDIKSNKPDNSEKTINKVESSNDSERLVMEEQPGTPRTQTRRALLKAKELLNDNSRAESSNYQLNVSYAPGSEVTKTYESNMLHASVAEEASRLHEERWNAADRRAKVAIKRWALLRQQTTADLLNSPTSSMTQYSSSARYNTTQTSDDNRSRASATRTLQNRITEISQRRQRSRRSIRSPPPPPLIDYQQLQHNKQQHMSISELNGASSLPSSPLARKRIHAQLHEEGVEDGNHISHPTFNSVATTHVDTASSIQLHDSHASNQSWNLTQSISHQLPWRQYLAYTFGARTTASFGIHLASQLVARAIDNASKKLYNSLKSEYGPKFATRIAATKACQTRIAARRVLCAVSLSFGVLDKAVMGDLLHLLELAQSSQANEFSGFKVHSPMRSAQAEQFSSTNENALCTSMPIDMSVLETTRNDFPSDSYSNDLDRVRSWECFASPQYLPQPLLDILHSEGTEAHSLQELGYHPHSWYSPTTDTIHARVGLDEFKSNSIQSLHGSPSDTFFNLHTTNRTTGTTLGATTTSAATTTATTTTGGIGQHLNYSFIPLNVSRQLKEIIPQPIGDLANLASSYLVLQCLDETVVSRISTRLTMDAFATTIAEAALFAADELVSPMNAWREAAQLLWRQRISGLDETSSSCHLWEATTLEKELIDGLSIATSHPESQKSKFETSFTTSMGNNRQSPHISSPAAQFTKMIVTHCNIADDVADRYTLNVLDELQYPRHFALSHCPPSWHVIMNEYSLRMRTKHIGLVPSLFSRWALFARRSATLRSAKKQIFHQYSLRMLKPHFNNWRVLYMARIKYAHSLLRQIWTQWKSFTTHSRAKKQKEHIAIRFATHTCLGQVMSQWKLFVVDNVRARLSFVAADEWYHLRLAKRTMLAWRDAVKETQQTYIAVCSHKASLIRRVFDTFKQNVAWNRRTRQSLHRLESMIQYVQCRNAIRTWKHTIQVEDFIKQHDTNRAMMTKRRVLHAFQMYVHIRQDKVATKVSATNYYHAQLRRRALSNWIEAWRSCQTEHAVAEYYLVRTQRMTFLAWKKITMDARTTRRLNVTSTIFYRQTLVARAMHAWKVLIQQKRLDGALEAAADAHAALSLTRRIWHAWTRQSRFGTQQRYEATERQKMYQLRRQAELFSIWRANTVDILYATDAYANDSAQRRFLRHWIDYVHSRVLRREANELANLHYQSRCLRMAWSQWEQFMLYTKAETRMDQEILEWRQRRVLRQIFGRWQEAANDGRLQLPDTPRNDTETPRNDTETTTTNHTENAMYPNRSYEPTEKHVAFDKDSLADETEYPTRFQEVTIYQAHERNNHASIHSNDEDTRIYTNGTNSNARQRGNSDDLGTSTWSERYSGRAAPVIINQHGQYLPTENGHRPVSYRQKSHSHELNVQNEQTKSPAPPLVTTPKPGDPDFLLSKSPGQQMKQHELKARHERLQWARREFGERSRRKAREFASHSRHPSPSASHSVSPRATVDVPSTNVSERQYVNKMKANVPKSMPSLDMLVNKKTRTQNGARNDIHAPYPSNEQTPGRRFIPATRLNNFVKSEFMAPEG